MPGNRPAALVLYHYMHPDDVVSAVMFTELSTGLAGRGWRVESWSCNRSWADESVQYRDEKYKDVQFRRVWRPSFRQSSAFGRMANAAWMVAAWSLLALHPGIRCDVLIVGTDPVLSPAVALAWRLFRPRVRIAHWCFDLYPEAAVSGGVFPENSGIVRFFRALMRVSYRRCDLIVDLGDCMRRLLKRYGSSAAVETIVPWAPIESEAPVPADPAERASLFGDARLTLLYSGSFGRAHTWEGIPELARAIAPGGGKIAFSVRGNSVADLRNSIGESGADIVIAPFAAASRTEIRLASADVHIVSLREEWAGTVVPSKFFSALAIGRPVLFVGGADSSIARLIGDLGVGWVLTSGNVASVAAELQALAGCEPEKEKLFRHCHETYWKYFSRQTGLDTWDRCLRKLV